MRLSRQLIILVFTLVLLLFVGTSYISLRNAQVYLSNQLASHAQDAATSLGLSLSSHLANRDQAMVQSMTDAMFDRGDYLQVRVEDLAGEPLVDRRVAARVSGVPAWFVNWIELDTPEGRAEVMAGWRQAGRVRVRSHPGHAYEQLWSTSQESLLWFLLGALVVLLLALIALRFLLRPLAQVEWQAESIARREFPIVDTKPITLEFRRVVEAMNRLSGKVQQMLSDSERMAARLREQAYQDPVTGLANRRSFTATLNHRIEDPEALHAGGLVLLQLRDFKEFNRRHGYVAGDQLLIGCAKMLNDAVAGVDRRFLARLTGADFGLLLEGLSREQFDELVEHLARALSGLYGSFELDNSDVGHLGAVYYVGQGASDLLSEADMALRSAQTEGANHWVIYEPVSTEAQGHAAGEWNAFIEAALERDSFVLERQPVVAAGSQQLLHEEIFLRLPDPDRSGELLPAGRFLPMAENVGLAPAVDRWVIDRVLRQLEHEPNGKVAVNLSHCSLQDSEMLGWLRETMIMRSAAARHLVLEFPEYGALANREALKEWIEELAPFGLEFSLDHFGLGFSSFAYLRNLKADYLKIDGSFVRHLEEHSDHQFFLQAVAEIAHGLDMRVIAESVETETVWQLLPGLGIDGGRGYWLGEPK